MKNKEFTLQFSKTDDGRWFCLAKRTPEYKLKDMYDEHGNNIECCTDRLEDCFKLLIDDILI